MEQIPIHEGQSFDNVVHLPGGTEPDDEPETATGAAPAEEPAIGALIGEGARIIGGFISTTSSAITTALRELAPPPEPTDDEDGFDEVPRTGPSPVGVATGAAIGLTMQVSEAAVRAATSFAQTAGPFLSWMTNSSTVRRRRSDVEARAEALNDRWTKERPASEEAASSFAGRILPELTNAILDKLDLTQIAIDHLDIDRILDSVDLDAVIERVDLNAVIHRVDLAGIATEVIGEIDLPELIRESTGAVTSETVRAVRMRSAEADLLHGPHHRSLADAQVRPTTRPEGSDDSSEASDRVKVDPQLRLRQGSHGSRSSRPRHAASRATPRGSSAARSRTSSTSVWSSRSSRAPMSRGPA